MRTALAAKNTSNTKTYAYPKGGAHEFLALNKMNTQLTYETIESALRHIQKHIYYK